MRSTNTNPIQSNPIRFKPIARPDARRVPWSSIHFAYNKAIWFSYHKLKMLSAGLQHLRLPAVNLPWPSGWPSSRLAYQHVHAIHARYRALLLAWSGPARLGSAWLWSSVCACARVAPALIDLWRQIKCLKTTNQITREHNTATATAAAEGGIRGAQINRVWLIK